MMQSIRYNVRVEIIAHKNYYAFCILYTTHNRPVSLRGCDQRNSLCVMRIFWTTRFSFFSISLCVVSPPLLLPFFFRLSVSSLRHSLSIISLSLIRRRVAYDASSSSSSTLLESPVPTNPIDCNQPATHARTHAS